jgi:phosphoribosylaminoimidazole-succinocarboxamide synthase
MKERQIYMNTLRYALRFLLRARTYTLINLLGLAFSLACCIILLRYIHRELTVDTHCVDREKVYAVQVNVSGGVERRGILNIKRTNKREVCTMSANELKPIKEGKVREIYDNGDSLIMVATDRISCFDVILNNEVTKKGTVLTQMSKFWFDLTEDILPNHMITVDVNEMPEFFRQPKFDGNSMMCKKLEMLPIECIVRGYITGSGWASYKENGTVCGIKLPEGLVESDKLPEPIYTPSTKAEIGDHDENISFEQSIDVLEKAFPGKGVEYAEKIKEYTIALYKK